MRWLNFGRRSDAGAPRGLLKVQGCTNPTRTADIVFVHGLGGSVHETWSAQVEPGSFGWPQWLADDERDIGVWSYGYAAEPRGQSMAIYDRATNFIDAFNAYGLGVRPIVFIAHSLGGLLVKKILQVWEMRDDAALPRVRGVVFFATPHTGANLATLVYRFKDFVGSSVSIEELRAHTSQLRELSEWYSRRTTGILTVAYSEGKPLRGFIIVDPDSANPSTSSSVYTMLDEDHSSIAKIRRRDSDLYRAIRQFVRKAVGPLAFDYHAFISHAEDDKEPFVASLAAQLKPYLNVWYGPFSLKPGDNRSESIKLGLGRSRFGIVILSAAYFKEKAGKEELAALLRRQEDGVTTLIPVWYRVDESDVARFDERLRQIEPVKKSKDVHEIAAAIVDFIRGELDIDTLDRGPVQEAGVGVTAVVTASADLASGVFFSDTRPVPTGASAIVYRVTRADVDPLQPPPFSEGRFTIPGASYPTLYTASTRRGAIVETFAPFRPLPPGKVQQAVSTDAPDQSSVVPRSLIAGRVIAKVRLAGRFVDLDAPASLLAAQHAVAAELGAIGVKQLDRAILLSAPRGITHRIAMHFLAQGFDGVRYPSRFGDHMIWAVFDRAVATLDSVKPLALGDVDLALGFTDLGVVVEDD